MFGIGGFNPVSLMATAAFGPAGGLVAQFASQIFSQMGQQFIQQLGQQMNLPQSSIDLAQGSFANSVGDFQGGAQNLDEVLQSVGQQSGSSPFEIADAQREANEGLQRLLNDLSQSDEVKDAKNGGRGGAGWLRAMADVLGKKLDALAHEMQDLAGKVNKEDPSTSTDFTVVSQEFNMLMNAVSTALKTIGEAMGKSASRQ